MPFPFTFKLAVPGLPNPFAARSQQAPSLLEPPSDSYRPIGEYACQRRLSPAPSLSAAPGSRKRRWEPSSAELSESATTIASTTGFLNVPDTRLIKFEMAASREGSEHGVDSGRFHLASYPLAPWICLAFAMSSPTCMLHRGTCVRDGLRLMRWFIIRATNPYPPCPYLQPFFY
jgi:hypothetical protein